MHFKQCIGIAGGHRATEIITLNLLAPKAADHFDFRFRFCAFCRCAHAKTVGHSNHGTDDGKAFRFALRGTLDKAAIYLDGAEACFAQIAK